MPRGKSTKQAQQEQKAAAYDRLSGIPLAGNLVMWGGGQGTHAQVVAALGKASLDEKVARELLPRHAFARACKLLEKERVIDLIDDEGAFLTFQFTKKVEVTDPVTKKQMVYSKETHLHLDRETGDVRCPVAAIKELAQNEVNRCLEHRGANDITRIVQRLFSREADLFPVRDQGGVYFVPQEHAAFCTKVRVFLEALGGKLTLFPVPAGTGDGDKSVQEAVAHALEGALQDHKTAIEEFGVSSHPSALEAAADKVKITQAKIKAYAHYLTTEKDRLLAEAEALKVRLTERVGELAGERAKLPPEERHEGGVRRFIFGTPVTAVIRWLGKEKFSFDGARRALDAFGCGEVADATIKTQLPQGKAGKGLPTFTPEQEQQLREAAADKAKYTTGAA